MALQRQHSSCGEQGALDVSLPPGGSTRWLLAGRAGMDFFSSDYCCSLAKGNAPLLEPLRLSHIIPERHPVLKGAVKEMTQEFVKKVMFPLIPCCPSGLVGTRAQEVVMRGEELNHIPAAPEAAQLLPLPGLSPPWGRGGRQKLWALLRTVSMC